MLRWHAHHPAQIPINMPDFHWYGLVVDFRRKVMTYRDSFNLVHPDTFERIKTFVEDQHQHTSEGSGASALIFSWDDWTFTRSLCARLQQNGCDCGVRTFGTLEDFSGGDGDERDWAICSIDQMREDMLMKMWEEGM